MNKGELTLRNIEEQMAIPESEGGIPQKQLKAIYNGHVKKTATALEKIRESIPAAGEYLKYIEEFISDNTDTARAREILAMAYENFRLDNNEGAVLNKLKSQTQQIETNKNMNFFISAYRAIDEYFGGVPRMNNSELAEAIKNLVARIGSEEDIDNVAEEIIAADKIKRNPAILAISAVAGVPYMDWQGRMKRIFRDGHEEEMK